MTTRLAQMLALCLAVTAIVGATSAAARTASGPTGLHPFLLRVDEPASRSFSRTPGFAWNPVKGAARYEFQLSTSASFRESGVIFSDTSLTSPVASPALTLPWITGSPHALYARVRAVLDDTTTAWSAAYGFDMEPSAFASPLPSYPGLLRWTPVDGAVAYQVWFVDLPKTVLTQTNVVDQREFYSFHQAASWLGQVRWRIRALRDDFNTRANGLPAVAYGPWSPVYSSVNPPFAVGALKPTATVSDVVTSGAASAPAHRLTPAFVFGGNQPLAGAAAELYRVQVFTDRRCINRVYTSAIIGSPAYAPRTSGPLALPRTGAAIAAARSSYLPDGDEGPSFSFDMDSVTANESMPAVTPTVGLPSGGAPAAPRLPPRDPAPARARRLQPLPPPRLPRRRRRPRPASRPAEGAPQARPSGRALGHGLVERRRLRLDRDPRRGEGAGRELDEPRRCRRCDRRLLTSRGELGRLRRRRLDLGRQPRQPRGRDDHDGRSRHDRRRCSAEDGARRR